MEFIGLARHREGTPRSYKSAALPTELRQLYLDFLLGVHAATAELQISTGPDFLPGR